MPLHRRDRNGPQVTWEELAREEFIWCQPCLCEFLCCSSWEGGVARTTGTLLLFFEAGTYRAALHDRDGRETLFASGASLADLLASLEAHLAGGSGDWRKDRDGGPKNSGRRS
jgi:hypothetical protein